MRQIVFMFHTLVYREQDVETRRFGELKQLAVFLSCKSRLGNSSAIMSVKRSFETARHAFIEEDAH